MRKKIMSLMLIGILATSLGACTKSQKTIGGAVIGAGVGGLAGNAIGGSTGAIIGGVAGATVGGIAGKNY